MKAGILRKISRAIAWRTFWRTRILVFRAAEFPAETIIPPGYQLVRFLQDSSNTAANAMQEAGEAEDLAAERFRNGDQFFGWQREGRIISFGWVTFNDRQIGQSVVPAAPGWAFLYNFHTAPQARGQNLYPQLLKAIIKNLTDQSKNVLIIDVNSRNKASLRGVEKAGFVPVGTTSWVTIFRRWNCFHSSLRLDRVPPIGVGCTLSGGEHVGTSQEPGRHGPGSP